MVMGVRIGQKFIKFARLDSVDKNLFLRNGYKVRGPYLVKSLG